MRKLTATVIKPGCISPKEAVVLKYLCEGYLRKEIAHKVVRSQSCISSQLESIAHKLDCHSAAEIVATATALNVVIVEITPEERPHWFNKFVSILLVINILFGIVGPRISRTARPVRTRTAASLVRVIRQA